MDVRIFDEDDRELPVGQTGEIVVRPLEPNVILSGYYNKPEEMVRSSRNFWFHTGDRGYLDNDGFLFFIGRSKELIRRVGEMISPVEIETKLRSMDGVLDCAVVGVTDAIMGEEIKAAVVAEPSVTPERIVGFLRGVLPRHQIPRYVEFLPAIPKTETEKVQRHKLQYLSAEVSDMSDSGASRDG
jgi:crotonobetaine/carnitine-CoA ligase